MFYVEQHITINLSIFRPLMFGLYKEIPIYDPFPND